MQMKTVGKQRSSQAPADANWMAVIALALGVASLIIAEFLPAGMLTPMAQGLGMSEGMTGQAVTATSVLAVVTSLLISVVTASFNRRTVLLSLSGVLVISNLLVAFAPNFAVLLLGRALVGISLGGFWSMAAAITARLVPAAAVPRALSIA
jgi:predicted MFS family arabinose efflux permease